MAVNPSTLMDFRNKTLYWEDIKSGLNVGKLLRNPSIDKLIAWSLNDAKPTKHSSYCFYSQVKNRSAKHTYIVEGISKLGIHQQPISREKAVLLTNQVNTYLKSHEVVCVDRVMGTHPEFTYNCRLYITKRYSRIAAMWSQTLAEPENLNNFQPHFTSVYVPEWPEKIIFCEPDACVTYILGTDYFGESKKSFLRMAMYCTKKRGGLGLHAGSKILRVKDQSNKVKDIGFIMFGLSGTGKTTLTIHDHGLKGDEKVIIRQDDVIMMSPDGSCAGTETGFYIKTEGLNETQKVLFDASLLPTALFENVMVSDDGTIDFDNTELTTNGRGVLVRKEIGGTDDTLDLPRANKIIFITRRDDVVPLLAKLTPEQAAAFFMLGESIETSAGDPTKAGQSKREVGTNPFIVGPEEDEGNRFLSILYANPDIECFLLNTGSIGKKPEQKAKKISVRISTELMKHIAKGDISWQQDSYWGYYVPQDVPGLDLSEYNPKAYYSKKEYNELNDKLLKERKDWLAKFKGLDAKIINVFK